MDTVDFKDPLKKNLLYTDNQVGKKHTDKSYKSEMFVLAAIRRKHQKAWPALDWAQIKAENRLLGRLGDPGTWAFSAAFLLGR